MKSFPPVLFNLHKNDIMIEITGIQEKNSYMGCKKMDDFFYIIDQIMVLRPKVNRVHAPLNGGPLKITRPIMHR